LLLLLRWSLSTNVSMYFCFFLDGLVIDHGGEEGNNVRFYRARQIFLLIGFVNGNKGKL